MDECIKALDNKDYLTFRKKYPMLYLQFVKEIEPNYVSAIKNVQSSNFKHTFTNLYELISEGYMLDEIKEDSNFRDLHTLNEWKVFVDHIASITANYNNDLRRELNKMQYEDQGIRLLFNVV